MWPYVNGVAMANKDKTVFCLGSDGSQQEGNDAEAARLAVAQNLNIKLFLDDNDVTIAGHPSQYLKGYELNKTLEGHGLKVITVQGEDIDALWAATCEILSTPGPAASQYMRADSLCQKTESFFSRFQASHGPRCRGHRRHNPRPRCHPRQGAHFYFPFYILSNNVQAAIKYLESRGYPPAIASDILSNIKGSSVPYLYIGSSKETAANRVQFGEAVSNVLSKTSKEENAKKVMVIDSDLEGSTGLKVIHQKHPEVFVPSGIMERGNFSAAAGFGYDPEKYGVFSTFAAFLEMVISELTMARLNNSNILCHFSHSGCDEMADNTCHFGINHFFADNGLSDVHSFLYFPADAAQMDAVIDRVFYDKGVRLVFSTRSKVPFILKEDGSRFFGPDYVFVPGKDEVIIDGTAGYVVSYGEMLYRSYDAVLRCRELGLNVGLINKPTLNLVDEQILRKIGSSPFVLVVESQNQKTGVGISSYVVNVDLTIFHRVARIQDGHMAA